MALDVDRLRDGLEEYVRTLAEHRGQLSSEHAELARSFDQLWSTYAGQMAEQLRDDWGRTSEWFEEYVEATRRLEQFLEDRLMHLRTL